MKDWAIKLLLNADGSRMESALGRGENRVRHFGGAVRKEFDSIRNAAKSLEGKLAGIGVSIGALMLIKQSAGLDKSLTQIGQTAGESGAKVVGLRKDLFRMAKETGQSVENLKEGFDTAVQAGLSFKEALPTTDAMNKAMAVSGAKAQELAGALVVAGTAFRFDLSKPNMALGILDKMLVAGRLGSAELKNLPDIFARAGVNAAAAGMDINKYLAYIEALSYAERDPHRLGTLTDSSLRVFTNLKYMIKAQQGTGVRFFDKQGGRRDPITVLTDIKKKYDLLKTDAQKELFIGKAFGEMDTETLKGLRTFFDTDMLSKVKQFTSQIKNASGAIEKDLPAAIDNAVDQTGRLKATLREAADAFVQPFNRGITAGIKKLLDSKEKGGMGLSGGQIIAGGSGALLAGYLGYRFGGPMAKKVLGKLGGDAAGIAQGKIVEAATGVTPVYVTNMPGSFGSDSTIPSSPGKKPPNIPQPAWWPKATPPAPGGMIAKYLPLLSSAAPAGAVAGVTVATVASLVGHEMNRRQLGDDQYLAIVRDAQRRSHGGRDAANAIQNVINMSINVDKNGKSTANVDSMNTKLNIKLNRSEFNG